MSKPHDAGIDSAKNKSKRGGARAGSGRKPGYATQKTREIAEKVAKSGLTPLEIMIEAMLQFRTEGDMDKAASVAKDAAPYMHPRLAAVEHTGKDGGALTVQVIRFGDDSTSE